MCIRDRGYHSHKLKPYRAAAKAEKAAFKANVDFQYHKALHDNPQIASTPLSRFMQKQQIKRQYAKAAKKGGAATAKKAAENTRKAAKKTAEETKRAIAFVGRHPAGVCIAVAALLLFCLLYTSENWCDFLNYFDASVSVQLSFINQGTQRGEAEKAVNIPAQEDAFNSIRTEYRDMLKNQLAKGNNCLLYTSSERDGLLPVPSR